MDGNSALCSLVLKTSWTVCMFALKTMQEALKPKYYVLCSFMLLLRTCFITDSGTKCPNLSSIFKNHHLKPQTSEFGTAKCAERFISLTILLSMSQAILTLSPPLLKPCVCKNLQVPHPSISCVQGEVDKIMELVANLLIVWDNMGLSIRSCRQGGARGTIPLPSSPGGLGSHRKASAEMHHMK